jgi:ubiquinone/menaquinone biosynthesis C-methylase UbiE
MEPAPEHDKWSQWLLSTRSGGEEGGHAKTLDRLSSVRDRVLANAQIKPGCKLLDVGTGDGLIGLAALDCVGSNGRVIFSDISEACLAYVEHKVRELAPSALASFILGSAESLDAVGNESVDVVTTRSVLIYVTDKAAAFKAFYRVLRPGGIISLAEPINRDYLALCAGHPHDFYGYDLSSIAPIAEKLNAADEVDIGVNPMTDFTHLNLINHCELVGFGDIHIEVVIDITRRAPRAWGTFTNSSPNPNALTIGEEIDRRVTERERVLLENELKPLVEKGIGVERRVMAYVRAVRRSE